MGIEPQVYCIAETRLNVELYSWFNNFDGSTDAYEIYQGSDSEKLIELCGRRCYKSFVPGLNPNVTKIRTESSIFHKNILSSKHGSVLEHASATFAFENVSRVFTHELVRHRVGSAYSQESLRYVRLEDIKMWLPPEIEELPDIAEIFRVNMRNLSGVQETLARKLNLDSCDFATKKKFTSAMRRIAPIGLATGIIATFNMRTLRWLIENRTSEAAEIEIRIVFNKVAEICVEKWPMIFQDFKPYVNTNGPPVWIPEWSKI